MSKRTDENLLIDILLTYFNTIRRNPRIIHLVVFLFLFLNLSAQKPVFGKLSHSLRQLFLETRLSPTRASIPYDSREVLALVKCSDERILKQEGCQTIRNWGDIYATLIPISHLTGLTKRPEVQRIETGSPSQTCIDTTAAVLGVTDLWQGNANLPALTGKDVVMGIMDIGFDLTHPTFYSRDLKDYRIRAFWDMLDPDSLNSKLYVGRDYLTKDSLLKKAHSTDGLDQTHGTHTSGIAAGSGYNSRYVGMAPDADLCLVANAVSGNMQLISEENRYKYNLTTDILGFQYIFDYAEKVGKPCVISFSEGSHEDLYGDAQLLYEVLDSLTGPGRIIVSSAGNNSVNNTYLYKPFGLDSISSFIYAKSQGALYTLRHSGKTKIDIHFSHTDTPDTNIKTVSVTTDQICLCEDSLYNDTIDVENDRYAIILASYPSCYDKEEWATELYVKVLTQKTLGQVNAHRVRITLNGADEEVECFSSGGLFMNISSLPQYCNSEATHNINFPASSSSIIAVGGTGYRTGVLNYNNKWKDNNLCTDGIRWPYSSVGPTMQGLTKPDVMAPACNVISAYSSFYLENHRTANDIDWDKEHFDFQGRTYAWNCNSGTSMSSPVVGGIVAQWLQLCPQLSPENVLQVIATTSKRIVPELSYPNNEYGWGEIDALEGARYIKSHFDCTNAVHGLSLEREDQSAMKESYDIMGRNARHPHKHGIYLIRMNGHYRKVVR